MTEDDLGCCILKVIAPYEGSAFMAAPGLAVSCVHVCVRDGQPSNIAQPVRFAYWPPGASEPLELEGTYDPTESDPAHDVAVVRLDLPAGVDIPCAPLSFDDQPEKRVVALGFPAGQRRLVERVQGRICEKDYFVASITFVDGTELDVLRIDTRGRRGFWADGQVRGGMSGGAILNSRTGTVVAIVEGKYPRGSMADPPEGYGIQLKHLAACSPRVQSRIKASSRPATTAKPAAPPPVAAAYREWLQRRCASVELLGLRLRHGQAVKLGNVYVPLTTTPGDVERGERHGRGPSLAQNPAGGDREQPTLLLDRFGESSLYVPGDPGSGKSTFCRWVGWLACEGAMPVPDVEPPAELRETLPAALCNGLPLLVPLRGFWDQHLPRGDAARGFTWTDLEAAFGQWVDRTSPDGLTGGAVRAHLARGFVLLVLDGIDEVPPAPRGLLIAALADAIPAWHRRGHRLLVTSRPYGLTPDEVMRLALPVAPIQPLVPDLQRLLVQRWFRILADTEEEGDATAADLRAEIERQDYLGDFAGNPLLLTALCIVFGHGKRLPQDRHELYDEIVNTVLHSRIDRGRREEVRGRLAAVAHGMHTGAGLAEEREVPETEVTLDEIDRILRAWQQLSTWTQSSARSVYEDRQELLTQTGLLLPRSDQRAAFYHFSFQEFLAAQQIAETDRERLAELFVERAARPEWRQTLGFVFGRIRASSVSPRLAEALLTALIGCFEPGTVGLQVVVADAIEVLIKRSEQSRPPAQVRQLLSSAWLATMRSSAKPADRCRLGDALALIGDPRFRAGAWFLRADPMLGFVEVPAGPFRMGSDARDRQAYDNERRAHEVEVPAFYIGRFPVTVAQFSAFVEDSGFESRDRDRLRGVANHPVVYVSWHDAIAYSQWLTGRLREWDGTPQPLATLLRGDERGRWCVALPSEAEWEKAARGTDGRIYPWGDEADATKANYFDTGIRRTSAVGCFAIGASPFGVEEASGNVWEWTRSEWKSYPYEPGDGRESMAEGASEPRVVRGGAFNSYDGFARAAVRTGLNPDDRLVVIGFRVVVSPFFSGL